MPNTKPENPHSLQSLNLLNDFLFFHMVSDEEYGEDFCRLLLQIILGKKIRKVQITPQKNIFSIDTKHHGIRLDAFIQDIGDSDAAEADILPDIYDVEPNIRYEVKTLPKRIRYYHGLIDSQLLSSNTPYDKLPNAMIIFILPYDPIGKGRTLYTIKNHCVEEPDYPYIDGACTLLLNTKGTKGKPSQELKDLLQYMENPTDKNAINPELTKLHSMVSKVKAKKEVNLSYMKSWEWEQIYREEGREEGRIEGRIEGRTEGIRALIATCLEFKIPTEDIILRIMTSFSLSREDAERYLMEHK